MTNMKRLLSIAAVLLVVFSLCGCEAEEKYPNHTESFYVNDFAEVLSDADEQELLTKAVALQNATTAQVVVATVNSLHGDEPYYYATELARQWGVGDAETDNGILVLLSTGDREIFIAVGYGLEGALPDSKTGRIIDVYGLEYLKNDEFGKGIKAISEALINEVYIEYGLEPEAGYVNIDMIPQQSAAETGNVLVSWIIMIIIIVILSFITRGRSGRFFFFGMPHIHTGSHGGFRSGGGFGGGFGGGGFRGGGGGFGGGGAGRGF